METQPPKLKGKFNKGCSVTPLVLERRVKTKIKIYSGQTETDKN